MLKTFELKNKSRFNIHQFLRLLVTINAITVLGMYIVALFPQMFRYKDKIMEATIPVIYTLLFLITVKLVVYVFKHSKNKIEKGVLSFSPDAISINGQNIPVDEIDSLRFIGNDILGDFRGYISKGTDNEMVLNLKNGQQLSQYFEQTKDNRLSNYEKDLAKYLEKGILTEANFYNIMNNTNYY